MNHHESSVIFKITIRDLLMIILLLNNSLPKYGTHFIVNGSLTFSRLYNFDAIIL
jgi:hypothetical protein